MDWSSAMESFVMKPVAILKEVALFICLTTKSLVERKPIGSTIGFFVNSNSILFYFISLYLSSKGIAFKISNFLYKSTLG